MFEEKLVLVTLHNKSGIGSLGWSSGVSNRDLLEGNSVRPLWAGAARVGTSCGVITPDIADISADVPADTSADASAVQQFKGGELAFLYELGKWSGGMAVGWLRSVQPLNAPGH